ncbi:23-dihydroxybenzoate-AMP ligase [Acinetobacter baumannii ATCC 17978]|nr:23-dihydroxybenzoate-AMP ligase [Acinetobacter baumannii ATCC 17978]
MISKNIAHFKIPDEIEVVADFKYTHVGKVNRQKLG